MSPLLLAAALSAVPTGARDGAFSGGAKTYGILVLAYDVDVQWRRELGSLRGQLKGHPVETVDDAEDAISVQRAVDRLVAQRAAKIVVVPLETVSESTRLGMTRFMFGARAGSARDVPDADGGDPADKTPPPIRAIRRSALVLPAGQRGRGLPGGGGSTLKRIQSPVPCVLAPALDKSPALVAILADRAAALSSTRARETLVLAGIGPRSDAALKAWKASAQSTADQVGAKAGYRKAVAVAVRDGVRAGQQDKDRADLKATFRALIREGRVAVVPLSPEAGRVDELLKKNSGGFFGYRWNGRGIQGDRRLLDWIKASAEEAVNGGVK